MIGKKSEKVRGLIDCNSFFASCEVVREPSRKGKCVCVGNDIVIAATYEAKAYGVGTGTPVREAKKILPPDAIFCPPDFPWYKKKSKQLMNLLADLSNKIEVFSIDEAFVDITGWDQKYGYDYDILATKLQMKILHSLGLPTSIGIATTRILAKMAAEKKKPMGCYVSLTDTQRYVLLTEARLRDVPFIGKKSFDRREYMCQTAQDFAQLDHSMIKQKMGRSGLKIRGELNGYNLFQFDRNQKPRSIVRTRSFNPHFTSDPQKVRKHVQNHVQRAYEQLIFHELKVKQIRLIMRDKNFARFGGEKKLPFATDDKETIYKIVRNLFSKLPFSTILYRTAGISFSDLCAGSYHQQGLFIDEYKTTSSLQTIIHQVKEKCGDLSIQRGVVQSGSRLRFQS